MDTTRWTLAYSPCPNDTYIFAALANHLIDGAPRFHVQLEDIESLNLAATNGVYELTKVSYGIVPLLMDRYRILRSGGALGRGCGPLLVAKPGSGKSLADFQDRLIAIPGERTTAFLLLQLAMGRRPTTIALRFDKIVEAVASGTIDAGLIIHESRFTYADSGLEAICDLGEWWEEQTGLPIPLGAILARNDLNGDVKMFDNAIKESLLFARKHEEKVMKYVREHAVEMKEEIMRKHIATYVNDFTEDVGDEGIKAVKELFARGSAAGIISGPAPVFA